MLLEEMDAIINDPDGEFQRHAVGYEFSKLMYMWMLTSGDSFYETLDVMHGVWLRVQKERAALPQ